MGDGGYVGDHRRSRHRIFSPRWKSSVGRSITNFLHPRIQFVKTSTIRYLVQSASKNETFAYTGNVQFTLTVKYH